MAFNEYEFQAVIDDFTVDSDRLQMVAADFRYDLRKGLRDPAESSLKLLPAYVSLPTGKETGEYLAVDFGGTNVRVLLIGLLGEGKYEVRKKVSRPLVVPGEYDFVSAAATAEGLFGFIADMVEEAIGGDHTAPYRLGHTFSFPSRQTGIYDARLIAWSKEFAVPGVEGQVVNDLLRAALEKRGLTKVSPVATVNDTVAVLLAAAYKHGDTYIGSIYATGYNACYLEKFADRAEPPTVLNLEAGGFMKLIPNRYDVEYDSRSERPGEQRLEKMVSGRYLGELYGLVLADLLGEKGKGYGFTSVELARMVDDGTTDLAEVRQIVAGRTGQTLIQTDLSHAAELARAILVRSARLVAATYVGLLWQLSGGGRVMPQHIAIEGSVYGKVPLIRENISRALEELLGDEAKAVDTVLVEDGSGLGAAIAAAMV